MITPSLDIVLDWLHAGAIAPDPRLPSDPEKDRRAEEMRRCFELFPGALDTILRMTLFRPPVNAALETGAAYRQYAQLREGQNQIAAGILDYIDHAKSIERKIRDARSEPEPHAGPGAFEPAPDPAAGPDPWPTDDPGIAVA